MDRLQIAMVPVSARVVEEMVN